MHKKLLAIMASIIVVVGAGFAFLLSQDKPTAKTAERSDQIKQASPATPSTKSESKANGAYIDYTKDTLATTKGTKILFFHAAWCPQCRKLEADIKSGSIPAGVTIFKVDYDTNQALRQEYGVTIQTTLVRLDDGGAFEKYVAYDDPTLDAVVQGLL
jgi:thiol-disulfide isomerase/thioredoxin